MTLIAIILATLAAGIGSVWLAELLMRLGLGGRGDSVGPQHLLSLAAGALLATAFMHLLPEAFESQAGAHDLFATLLVGLVFFFLLDKAELWHHGHEHHPTLPTLDQAMVDADVMHGHAHDDAHAHADHAGHHHAAPLAGGGWAVLTGDAVHCFGDGVLIASAFLSSPALGWAATLAVLVHEVPHHMGDLAVLHQGSRRKWRAALVKVSLAGAVTALGGVVGWALVEGLAGLLPYLLMLAASSFIYVALADLIPQLQKRLNARQTAAQIVWLLIGMALVIAVGLAGPEHAH